MKRIVNILLNIKLHSMENYNEKLDKLKACAVDVRVFGNEELKTRYPDLNILDAFRKMDAQVAEALRERLI